MKKLLALLVCVLLVFALASCGDDPCSHSDVNNDHVCDACSTTMGEHTDTNNDHNCDYGCADKIGTCKDEDKDHDCDYGCDKIFDEHDDGNDDDHLCDYGCEKIADEGCYDTVVDGKCDECGADIEHTCVDENKNHACDICSTSMGDHIDAGKDHNCDYGCTDKIGTCEDEDKDHNCDYGCNKTYGTCEDEDKDHDCDYGCHKVIGVCEDANKDHICDYGCDKTFGEHSDSATDGDHACDYGCKEAIEYTATFKVGNEIINTVKYTIGADAITVPAVPTRVGYTGVWESYSLNEENITVNAIYTAIEYTATFMDGTTVVYKVKFTVETQYIAEPAVPEHNGCVGYWESYTLGTEDITVNAVYSIKQYTTTWKNNDGTVIKTTKCDHGSIPSFGNEIPTRESDSQYSYTFSGWATEIVVAMEDATYIAIYTKSNRTSYTIMYDANGGTNAPSSQNKAVGVSIKLSTKYPSNSGKPFMGWRCANDGKLYSAGESFNIDSDVTLYAEWGYYCGTCSGNGTITSSYKCYTCSGSGSLSETKYKKERCSSCSGRGYYEYDCSTCGGLGQKWNSSVMDMITCWSCNGAGGTRGDCAACVGGYREVPYESYYTCSICNGSGDRYTSTTCTSCHGNPVYSNTYKTYNVTLNDRNSVVGTQTVTSKNPYKLTIPTRNGYTFIGWFDSAENGTQYTDREGNCLSVWSESANKTLYARWNLNYYTIKYDCDEDVDLSGMPTVYTVEDEDFALNSQNKTHYSFSWKLDNITVTSIDTAIAQDIVIKGIRTFMASSPVTENRVAATCTEDGHYDSVVYCGRCDEELSRETITIPAAHTPKSAIQENRVESTCTEDGHYESVVYCSVCNEELSRETIILTKLGHSPKAAVEENRIETTCTEDGHYDSVVYCSVCNDEISRETIILTKLGHSTKTIEENRIEATCYEDGSCDKVVYCDRCNSELSRETKVIPQTHKYKGTTCTECGLQYKREGNYIYFGEYPQTLKASNVTITTTTDNRGYYLGSDGFYYAKVVADPNGSNYKFSTGATVNAGQIYYFKVEPIRWRILSEDMEEAFVLCDSIIANKAYDSSNNNYANSDIRLWLNTEFYDTAFSKLQRDLILTTMVDNSISSTGYSSNQYTCENTNDKVFLLSYTEVINSDYGFSSTGSTNDNARKIATSDYSRATGGYMNSYSSKGENYWWLRSASYTAQDSSRLVSYLGTVSRTDITSNASNGVVPALRIRL